MNTEEKRVKEKMRDIFDRVEGKIQKEIKPKYEFEIDDMFGLYYRDNFKDQEDENLKKGFKSTDEVYDVGLIINNFLLFHEINDMNYFDAIILINTLQVRAEKATKIEIIKNFNKDVEHIDSHIRKCFSDEAIKRLMDYIIYFEAPKNK